jgi:hypothetical protein
MANLHTENNLKLTTPPDGHIIMMSLVIVVIKEISKSTGIASDFQIPCYFPVLREFRDRQFPCYFPVLREFRDRQSSDD